MLKFIDNAPWNRPKVLLWVILFMGAINMIFLGGKRRAFGSYVAVLRKEFSNVTLTELNLIADSYSALGYMTSGLSTMLILHFDRRYGLFQLIAALFIFISCIASSVAPNPHWMFLTHMFIHGIGSSLIISNVALVVNEHFGLDHPYHLLATTLISGGSIAFIFVTFFAYLIQKYQWRLSFVILGAIYLVINGSAAIFFKRNDELTEQDDRRKMFWKCKRIHRRQTLLLVLYFIERIITSVVTYGLLMNLTDFLHRTQDSLVDSSILTTLFAAGEASTYLIGAIITAATKDFFQNKLKYIMTVTSVLMGICLMILEFIPFNRVASCILCFISGVMLGPSVTFLFPAGEELTQLPGHIAYPFSLAGMGVGMLLSPVLTARVAEVFMYKWFFLVQACLIFIKSFCLLAIVIILAYYETSPLKGDVVEILSPDHQAEVEADSPTETTQLISEDSQRPLK